MRLFVLLSDDPGSVSDDHVRLNLGEAGLWIPLPMTLNV